jgi:hypothetical protein
MISAMAAHAGPEVTVYLTLPLGTSIHDHVFGLRLDKSAAPPDVRVVNPESPLNRRALMDLQLGAKSGLRLELARRLTWDFDRQELRQSSPPASFTLRLPVHAPASTAVTNTSPLTAALANPLQDQSRKPLVKPLAVEP